MAEVPVYQALARAFRAEGTDTHFTLLGDGNMHWAICLAQDHGVRNVHARHEHCACSMATGYAWATGTVGIASVTMGPGFTQITTALAQSAQSGVPLVVFAGDTPTGANWHLQDFPQAPIVQAAGARHIAIRNAKHVYEGVREAFYLARTESATVVLSVPLDIQKQLIAADIEYSPSISIVPSLDPAFPHPAAVDRAVDMIDQAERPIIVAGRGAVSAGAADAIAALAERCGALLSNTLPANALFGGSEFSIGIAGGFSGDLARELFADADLVIAIGASLGHFTSDGGRLFAGAKVIQIDTRPRGLWQGRRIADMHICADGKAAAVAIGERLVERQISKSGFRTRSVAHRIKNARLDEAEFPPISHTVDPRRAVEEIDGVVPKEWDVVAGSGHSFAFSACHVRDRPPQHYLALKEFGAIGSSLSYAMGVAAARNDGRVILFDGDGSLLMHIQEFETIKRHGLGLLIVVLNDGAYGTEVHKLNAEGIDPSQCIFGRSDFASIARGFGLRGTTVNRLGEFARLFAEHEAVGETTVWDVHIAENVVAPYRRPNRAKE